MRCIGVAAVVAIMGLSACNQSEDKAAAPAAAPAAPPQPSQSMVETFGANCTWGEVQGSGVSVWSYSCPQYGNSHMVYDASLPGFAFEATQDGETARRPTILVFKKAADAPLESILTEARAKSPGPHTAQCTLQRPTYDGVQEGIYHLMPPQPIKAQWDAQMTGDFTGDPIDAPCGELGEHMSGDHVFYVLKDDPTTVLWVDFGSEIQPFYTDSIRPIPAS